MIKSTSSAPKHEPQYFSSCPSLPPCLCKGLSIYKKKNIRETKKKVNLFYMNIDLRLLNDNIQKLVET